ncbi:NACHT domain-containing protein [Micromonospora sp. NPDC126480]|uniref:NACHT domain-containing protein n=1 Tax=Micromonospora sp. NPDC126480 TaxID=3155312 RepID=UPI00332870E0
MGQTAPDPGGSASVYQYYLALLGWLGLGRPGWAPWLFGAASVAVMLLSLTPLLRGLAGVLRYAKGWWDRRRDPRRVRRRALFADHVESQLRRLDEKEEWRDHRFARLEAEVETEGGRGRLLPRWIGHRRASLRREKSLSRALQRSDERLIILQGEPGSGKSVALRNAARAMANRVLRRPRLDSRIPLYVNLKELRPIDGRLDAETVRTFVLEQLNRANSRDVEQFLSDEFAAGMREGTWLFLFDSFDEIPEVLTATELDETVGRYADALYDFLHGMNVSPGVIASREFKGPRRFGWPRFTVQRLTERQKRELIRKADLEPAAEAEVYAALTSADPLVTQLSGNPMLLGLLCEHVRTTGSFPGSSHTVFETFVHSRLERDRERVRRRFDVDPVELRQVAEEIAFRLTAESGVGLSPTRTEVGRLLSGVDVAGGPVDSARLARHLDALEYVKLAQAPEGSGAGDERRFTFAHRRFQEYFATCVVIREPNRVPADRLLLDGRWRETAVAMLQTQRGDAVAALVTRAAQLLAEGVAAMPPAGARADVPTGATEAAPPDHGWPPHSLHLLDLLDTGLAGRPEDVPDDLRATVTTLVHAAWASGRRHHQLWAVQASLLAEPSAAETVLEESFTSKSLLLRSAAHRYAGRMPALSPELGRHLRLGLMEQAAQGRLLFDWPPVRAQLSRLGDPLPQLRAARLLRWTPPLTALLVTLVFVGGAGVQGGGSRVGWVTGWALAFSFIAAFWGLDTWLNLMRARRATAVSWSSDAVVHTGVRFVSLLVGIGIAVDPGRPASGHAAWGLLFLTAVPYAVFWPGAAVAAVAWGLDVRISRWAFLPFAVVPAGARTFRRMKADQRVRAMSRMLAIVAVLPLMLVVQVWLTRNYPTVEDYVTWAGYLLGGAFCLLLVVSYLRCERVDRRRLASLSPQRVLDAAALAELIRRLRSDDGLRRLVTQIRTQRIDCDRDSLAVLSELASRVHRIRTGRAARPWWRRITDPVWWSLWTPPSAGNVSEGTLDEVARLIAERTELLPAAAGPQPAAPRQRPGDPVPDGAGPARRR